MQTIIWDKKENGIGVITLHRPEAANALSLKMLRELQDVLRDAAENGALRVVILTGAGERAFCAGADLKERAGMSPQQVRQTVSLIRETIQAVAELPQPVLAAVNGVAFGGGTELALACDIRLAAEEAQFGLTETSWAIIPGAGGTQRLPRLIGPGRAKELIFTARRITAEEALSLGLVEHVVPQQQLMERTFELAHEIVNNGPIAVQQAKFAINRGCEVDLYTGLAIEQAAYEKTIPTQDRLEGLRAFREKRKPVYRGE